MNGLVAGCLMVALTPTLGRAASGAPCQAFRVHEGMELPSKARLQEIRRKLDVGQNSREKKALNREFWRCAEPYLILDEDRDGLTDWAVSDDHELSTTLFPNDPDLDDDGVENLFDPAPNNARIAPRMPPGGVPAHLELRDPRARVAQKRLFARYGILSVDHTDQHSPQVLAALEGLLEHGLPQDFAARASGFRVLYAFAGHDRHFNQAAYHPQMKAISIGGARSYPAELDERSRLALTQTLAHEIGHVALFDLVDAHELQRFTSEHTEWKSLFGRVPTESLLDPVFFRAFPGAKGSFGIPTDYSAHNLHEWFAEVFAASTLKRIAARGRLSPTALRRTRADRLPSEVDQWIQRLLRGA